MFVCLFVCAVAVPLCVHKAHKGLETNTNGKRTTSLDLGTQSANSQGKTQRSELSHFLKKVSGLQKGFPVRIPNFSKRFLSFLGTRIIFIVVAESKVVTPFYYSGVCHRNSYYVCWITDGSWQTNKRTAEKTWKPL